MLAGFRQAQDGVFDVSVQSKKVNVRQQLAEDAGERRAVLIDGLQQDVLAW